MYVIIMYFFHFVSTIHTEDRFYISAFRKIDEMLSNKYKIVYLYIATNKMQFCEKDMLEESKRGRKDIRPFSYC